MILNVAPKPWNSAHDPKGVNYVYDFESSTLTSVTNNSGYAQFNLGGSYTVTPIAGVKIHISSGAYAGYHKITTVIGPTQFATDTLYAGNQAGAQVKHLRIPQIELWTGYKVGEGYELQLPYTKVATFTPKVSPAINVKINVSEFLISTFQDKIKPPVLGVDFNTFNRFRLRFDSTDQPYYTVLNSAIPTDDLNVYYVNTGAYLNTNTPAVVFSCGYTVLSKIMGNVVYADAIENAIPSGDYAELDYKDIDYNVQSE